MAVTVPTINKAMDTMRSPPSPYKAWWPHHTTAMQVISPLPSRFRRGVMRTPESGTPPKKGRLSVAWASRVDCGGRGLAR